MGSKLDTICMRVIEFLFSDEVSVKNNVLKFGKLACPVVCFSGFWVGPRVRKN